MVMVPPPEQLVLVWLAPDHAPPLAPDEALPSRAWRTLAKTFNAERTADGLAFALVRLLRSRSAKPKPASTTAAEAVL